MDTLQWTTHQEINGAEKSTSEMGVQKKVKPPNEQALNCPRCNSTNTKFCYYNNYSLNQPRYFCKTCRRYWTEGGTLRNIPVGGGSRKNRKSLSSFSISTSVSSTSTHNQLLDLNPPFISHQLSDQSPNGHDLNLAFHEAPQHECHHGVPQFLQLPKSENSDNINSSCSNPAIGFSFDGRLSFPVGETRRYLGTNNEVVNDQINEGQENYNGSWNRIFGGGSW